MAMELKVPKVGESVSEVEIGEWLKKEGDSVAVDETIVMLDSAKTTVELPAPVAGVISKIVKQTGETAQVGDTIAILEESGAASATSSEGTSNEGTSSEAKTASATKRGDELPAASASNASASNASASNANVSNAPVVGNAQPDTGAEQRQQAPHDSKELPLEAQNQERVMPAAQRLLAQNQIAAEDVQASGPGGRVLKEDVVKHIEANQQSAAVSEQQATAKADVSTQDSQAASPENQHEEIVPMSMLRRHIAQRLVEAQQTAALLTTFNEIDMSAVMGMRKDHQDAFSKKYGIKLGFMSFFVKATIDALKLYPAINAEIRGKDIVYKNRYDIGVAIGSGKGLVVPVIRQAERLSFAEIEKSIADYAVKAKENKLVPDDLMGGTFTITNGGIYGSMMSTPIVNAPQSGILGMHAITERPIAKNGEVVIRPMMYVALTYDHRIVDGREAVSFLVRIKECIENPARMLIEV